MRVIRVVKKFRIFLSIELWNTVMRFMLIIIAVMVLVMIYRSYLVSCVVVLLCVFLGFYLGLSRSLFVAVFKSMMSCGDGSSFFLFMCCFCGECGLKGEIFIDSLCVEVAGSLFERFIFWMV